MVCTAEYDHYDPIRSDLIDSVVLIGGALSAPVGRRRKVGSLDEG